MVAQHTTKGLCTKDGVWAASHSPCGTDHGYPVARPSAGRGPPLRAPRLMYGNSCTAAGCFGPYGFTFRMADGRGSANPAASDHRPCHPDSLDLSGAWGRHRRDRGARHRHESSVKGPRHPMVDRPHLEPAITGAGWDLPSPSGPTADALPTMRQGPATAPAKPADSPG